MKYMDIFQDFVLLYSEETINYLNRRVIQSGDKTLKEIFTKILVSLY